MNNEDKPKLALRVFKRTSKHLILLWRRVEGVDPLGAEITFRELSDKVKDGTKPIKISPEFVHIDEPVEGADREVSINPSHEREDRQKNVHLMGWDDESQTWRKVSVVKGPKNRYYLGTLCAGCSTQDGCSD